MVTTAPVVPSANAEPDAQTQPNRSTHAQTGSAGHSVMREWVDELTGRTERAAAGLRVPNEAEITQLTSMFPDLRREDVVGALQRR